MRTPSEIRVLVHGANYVFEAVERSLDGLNDIRVVEGPERRLRLVDTSDDPRPDVVVTSLSDQETQRRYQAAFFTKAGVPFIAISKDSRRLRVYDQWEIREVGIDQLAAAVRELARHKRRPRIKPRTE